MERDVHAFKLSYARIPRIWYRLDQTVLASFFGDAEIPLEGNIEAGALQIVRDAPARERSDDHPLLVRAVFGARRHLRPLQMSRKTNDVDVRLLAGPQARDRVDAAGYPRGRPNRPG